MATTNTESLPLWIQLLLAFGTLILGGGTVAAFFQYRTAKQRNRNDFTLGQLAHEGEEENADTNRWEKLTIAVAARLETVEARVTALEAELAEEREAKMALERDKLVLERENNLQKIYIDRLLAAVTPPVPERPAGLV